jgi:hypothetical protein
MDAEKIQQLLELIENIVNQGNVPWATKKQTILSVASENEATALEEFVSWFSED